MNISGMLLTLDNHGGENMGTIRFVSINWKNVVPSDNYILLVVLRLLKTAHANAIR